MNRLEMKILGVIVLVLVLGCVFAVGVTVFMEKSSLYKVSSLRTMETAQVIAKTIERTMIEGKAEVTRAMVSDLRTTKGIEDVNVYNSEGLEAFGGGGRAIESDVLERLKREKDSISLVRNGYHLIYRPLLNRGDCRQCHGTDRPVLGAIRIAVPLESEDREVRNMLIFSIVASIAAILGLSILMITALRRMVIRPVREIGRAAELMSDGDLSFPVSVRTRDEIGALSRSMKDSLYSISGILIRISDVARRISNVSAEVESASERVLEGTQIESEAISNISSSVEELNASIAEISEGSDSLAASVEEIAASLEQMSASITQIGRNTLDLFSAMEDTSASIEEMSISIKEVAEGADELARAADETVSAIEELDSSVKEINRNAQESSALSRKVVDEAIGQGLKSVEKTIGGMEKIRERVEKTASIMRQLGDRSEEVGKILTVIDEITEQTSLLALNAAILASQAGEHGKGFSVVADEIKDLADRTSFSTQEIAALINAVQKEVSEAGVAMEEGVEAVKEGFELARESGEALKKIVESAEMSSEMTAAIERSTEHQAKAVSLVSESMEKIREMISNIARSTAEQSKGASLIIQATERIRDITAQVKNASEEQSSSSGQISEAMEHASGKTQQISRALREQRSGSEHIKEAVARIQQLPEQNRERAFSLNRALKDLKDDADLLATEMKRFRFPERKSADVITFGVVPLASPAEMFNRFRPLTEYLATKLGRKVELRVAKDLNTAVNEINEGITQLCFLTPSTYIKAHRQGGTRVLVKALRDGKPYHHSVIIANPDSGIDNVEDIRGRSFAFGDENSTSSHIVPRFMLFEAGIKLDDLSEYAFLKRQDNVAEAVLKGEFDAGGVMEATALRYREKGIRLVKFSDEIPEFNICVTRLWPDEEVRRALDALLSLDDSTVEGSAIMKSLDSHYTGFAPADDSDYDRIRDIMHHLGLY